MFELVGQTKLKKILDSYTLATLPKTLLFVGEQGCGKRAFATQLATRLSIELLNISEACTDDDLDNYQQYPLPRIYLIDLRKFSEKEQNKFLKFIEEPSDFCHIILVANTEFGILDTILSRCTKLYFAQYTFEEMKQVAAFFNPDFDQLSYELCKTPGKLIEFDSIAIKPLSELCNRLITGEKLSYGEVLAVFTQINCYENYDQFSYEMFLNMMSTLSAQVYKQTDSQRALKIFLTTSKFLTNKQLAPKVSKVDFLINYLSELSQEVI